MATVKDESWLFVAEWYDPMPQLKRKYLLKYFPKQHQAELVDLKSRKLFLKKSPCPPELSVNDFYVGGRVLLYAREFDIVDFGDETTRTKLSFQAQQCALLLSAGLDILFYQQGCTLVLC
jgi:nucleoside-diphosphate kinase